MTIDCHVHIAAFTDGHGWTSESLQKTIAFRFMRWRLGMKGADAQTERALEATLIRAIDETSRIDAVVLLAFDAVHDREGRLDRERTHLYATNDYVIDIAARNPKKVLFGASIHPYRKDAVQELERCAKAGAVLVKWLPPTQGMNPADELCFPMYEAMAHLNIPLLCHTGGEQSLPKVDLTVKDPALVEPALKRGVHVIAAHCGTRSAPFEKEYLATFLRMAREHEHFYGDTAALNLPTRSYAYKAILEDPVVREKLVHGSDWPILPVPPLRAGIGGMLRAWRDPNWLRRDVKIKESLGFDDAYWGRAAKVLRLPPTMPGGPRC